MREEIRIGREMSNKGETEMAEKAESPYVCHVFVCTNNRHGERTSCADGDSADLRLGLKEAIRARGWSDRVRVSQCGCMGLCEVGANVMIYPQKVWFSRSDPHDSSEILACVEKILADS